MSGFHCRIKYVLWQVQNVTKIILMYVRKIVIYLLKINIFKKSRKNVTARKYWFSKYMSSISETPGLLFCYTLYPLTKKTDHLKMLFFQCKILTFSFKIRKKCILLKMVMEFMFLFQNGLKITPLKNTFLISMHL